MLLFWGGHSNTNSHSEEIKKEVRIEIKGDTPEMAAATITTNETIDAKTVTEKVVISGTLEEVKTAMKELEGYTGDIQVQLNNGKPTPPAPPTKENK